MKKRRNQRRSKGAGSARNYDFAGLLKSLLNKAIEKFDDYTGIGIPRIK